MILEVKKQGDSLSIIIPKEMAATMNLNDGDQLYAKKTSGGYEILPYNPNFEKKMLAARKGMNKYRNALIELAK